MYKASIFLLYIFSIFKSSTALVEVTNIKCLALDRNFLSFDYCFIKAVNRTYRYISLRAHMLQLPINDAIVHIMLMKKSNGYTPYLFDTTIDGCKFFRESKNPIIQTVAYSFVQEHSNMNHTCPFDHDIMLEKLDMNYINNRIFKWLPISTGEYAVYTTWTVKNVVRAKVNVYGRLTA